MKSNRKIEMIQQAIDSAPIENKKYVRTIEVKPDRFNEELIVRVRFQDGMLDANERDNFLDELWKVIYNYTNIHVGLINLNKAEGLNEQVDRAPKILNNFMQELEIEGICGFWIDEEEDIHGKYWVYIILDSDMLEGTKPGFVAQRFRAHLKSEIKKFTNIDVEIGSISRKCD